MFARPSIVTATRSKTSFTPTRGGLLQRKCACGGTPDPTGECEACSKKRLQRKGTHPSSFNSHPLEVPPIVHDVLRSPGQPLDANTRAFMEPRFGHDFSRIPVHTNAGASIQQKPRVNVPDDKCEAAADRIGDQPLKALNANHLEIMKGGGTGDMRGEGEGTELDDREGALTGGLIGALGGAAIGAVIGSVVPGIGTGVGALVGGAVGAIGGAIAGHLLSCSASATGVSLGASGPINDGTVYGLRTPINVRGTELADVLDSESVGASIDHTGSMVARPSATSNNSGFMAADSIPDDRHTSGIADHLSFFDGHGGEGSYSRLQMDLFKIPKCNINTAQPMPNSGYRVKRTVKAEGTSVVGIITKTAEAVTVGSNSSTAGLTAKKEAKVTLRP